MGLKTNNYICENINVVLPEAYAQISNVVISMDGRANAMFTIQQNRDAVKNNEPIDTKAFTCNIDKDKPAFKQVYDAAKKEIFIEWEDDIVEED